MVFNHSYDDLFISVMVIDFRALFISFEKLAKVEEMVLQLLPAVSRRLFEHI